MSRSEKGHYDVTRGSASPFCDHAAVSTSARHAVLLHVSTGFTTRQQGVTTRQYGITARPLDKAAQLRGHARVRLAVL